jgi:TM2 domain-containing membrane protein YozV
MKDKQISYLLWCLCLVGIFGVHRFYLRRYVTAIIWFFTFGFLLIGQIVDLFLIPGIVESENRRRS